MSRSFVRFAVPVILAATPVFAQGYAPAPSPAAPDDSGPQIAPPQRAAVDRLEAMLWDAAVRANTSGAFATYLNRYPHGAHSEDAEAAIDHFRRNPPAPVQASAPVSAPQAAPAVAVSETTTAEARLGPVQPVPAPAAVAAPAPSLAPMPATVKPPVVAPNGKLLPIRMVDTVPVPVAPNVETDPTPTASVAVAQPPKPAPLPLPAPVAAAPMRVAMASIPAQHAVISEASTFICRPHFSGDTPYEQAGEVEISAYLRAVRANSISGYQAYLAAYPNGAFAAEVNELVAARQGRMTTLASLGGPGPAPARARTQVMPGAEDYPALALRDGQQGKVTAIWEVAEDGCVEVCRVEKSSGSAALDAATCHMMTAKGRYDPALDAQGKPMRSVDSATFAWNLPQH